MWTSMVVVGGGPGPPPTGDQRDQGGASLERGLDPLEFLLDLPTLLLAGLLDVGVGRPVLAVGGGEPGDAAPEVVLQLSVGGVRARRPLEGLDLAHHLRDAPESRTGETREKVKPEKAGTCF